MKVVTNVKLNKEKTIFAVTEGEYKKFGSGNMKKEFITISNLSKLDMQILQILNKFFCVTIEQCAKILKKSKIMLQEEFRVLEKKGLVKFCQILNKNNNLITSFYFLEPYAKEILKNKNIDIKNFNIRNKNLVELKKILEWNEIFINMIERDKYIQYNNNINIFSEFHNKFFKINGGYIRFANGKHYIFEIVREERQLEMKLLRKVKAYNDYWRNFNSNAKNFSRPPQLILVFENDVQVLYFFYKLINKCNNNFLSFTTDLRVKNMETLCFDKTILGWIINSSQLKI